MAVGRRLAMAVVGLGVLAGYAATALLAWWALSALWAAQPGPWPTLAAVGAATVVVGYLITTAEGEALLEDAAAVGDPPPSVVLSGGDPLASDPLCVRVDAPAGAPKEQPLWGPEPNHG